MDNSLLLNKEMVEIVWNESPIVIAIMEESGKFIYVNAMAQKFWEYTADELLDRKWQHLTHPEDLATDAAMHLQLKNGDFEDGCYSMCKRYITKSGRVIWGSVTVHILKNVNGERLYFLSQVVPLDAMHHINNKSYDAIEQSRKSPKTSTSNVPKKQEPMGVLQFIDKYRWILLGLLGVVSSIIIFLADFKYNQQRIADVEKKIESLNEKVDVHMSNMTKLMEQLNKKVSP